MSESLAWTPQPHPQLHPQKDEGRFVKVPLIVLKHLWPTDGMGGGGGGGGGARESKISSLDGWQTT